MNKQALCLAVTVLTGRKPKPRLSWLRRVLRAIAAAGRWVVRA